MVLRKQALVSMALLILSGLSVSACSNTFHGAGQDIENAGEAVQDATH